MRTQRWIFWTALFILGSSPLLADTVELRNGELITGHFVSADSSFVKIQVGTEVRTFRTGSVSLIRFSHKPQAVPLNSEQNKVPVEEKAQNRISDFRFQIKRLKSGI